MTVLKGSIAVVTQVPTPLDHIRDVLVTMLFEGERRWGIPDQAAIASFAVAERLLLCVEFHHRVAPNGRAGFRPNKPRQRNRHRYDLYPVHIHPIRVDRLLHHRTCFRASRHIIYSGSHSFGHTHLIPSLLESSPMTIILIIITSSHAHDVDALWILPNLIIPLTQGCLFSL